MTRIPPDAGSVGHDSIRCGGSRDVSRTAFFILVEGVCIMLWLRRVLLLGILLSSVTQLVAQDNVDLYGVREERMMIPMRDGTKLSAYLYFPPGDGPWPVLYEQRYADLKGVATRHKAAGISH